MLLKGLIGAEISSTGIFVVFKKGNELKYQTYEDWKDFLKAVPKFSTLRTAISREEVFIRKMSIPKEALQPLQENPKYLIEDFFPTKDLEVFFYISSEDTLSYEVFIIGVRTNLIESLRKVKKIEFATISSFLYTAELKQSSFIRILRKLPSGLFEYTIYKEGKLKDSFLLTEEEAKGKSSDLYIDDPFWVAEKLVKIPTESVDFKIVETSRSSNYVKYLILANVILSLVLGYEYINYAEKSNELGKVEKELEKLSKNLDEYYYIANKIESLRKKIEKIKSFKSNSLYYLYIISKNLPRETKLYRYLYEKGKYVIIEGVSPSTIDLVKKLEKSKAFKTIVIENISERGNKLEEFRIRLSI